MEITNKTIMNDVEWILDHNVPKSKKYGHMMGELGESIIEYIIKNLNIKYKSTKHKDPLDFIIDDRYGVELKTICLNEYNRVRMNPDQIKLKNDFCLDNNLIPIILVLKIDLDNKKIELLYKNKFKSYPVKSLKSASILFHDIDPAINIDILRIYIKTIKDFNWNPWKVGKCEYHL